MRPLALEPKVHPRGGGSRFQRLGVGRQSVAEEHLSLVRKNVTEILRVLSCAEGGRLHYGVVQHLVNQEVGRQVSGLHLALSALSRGGLVRKLPNKEGYEITASGREFHSLLEKILTISGRSNGNGGVGVDKA